MIALVEGAIRQRTPNEIALTLVLSAFTLIFLIVVVPLWPMAWNAEQYMMGYLGITEPLKSLGTDVPTLVALLVCLIPTTIGALLAAIGIAGMDRALQANIIAKSGKAVEIAGDIDIAAARQDRHDHDRQSAGDAVRARRRLLRGGVWRAWRRWRRSADETPEGKSIVELARKLDRAAPEARRARRAAREFVAFTAQTRMSGVDLPDGRRIRKGAPDAVLRLRAGSRSGDAAGRSCDEHGRRSRVQGRDAAGGRATAAEIAGVVVLEDILKPGISERFERLRKMGLRTVMITGDNPLTAATIAAQAGVDDFIAQATPEAKLAYIRKEQAEGKLVAMMGDGTNDAPALAQADVGVAMNSGTQAAKEAGNMVDLDSDPTKLIEVVEIGKQLLMTRGALTTFSIANDVAKYFAIVPALFAGTLPWLKAHGRHASALADVGDPVGGDLQRHHHPAADPDRAAAASSTGRSAPMRCCAATC